MEKIMIGLSALFFTLFTCNTASAYGHANAWGGGSYHPLREHYHSHQCVWRQRNSHRRAGDFGFQRLWRIGLSR